LGNRGLSEAEVDEGRRGFAGRRLAAGQIERGPELLHEFGRDDLAGFFLASDPGP
jgi:hypothetical protein